mmetsp:Transcript_7778/g.14665  ORF Transcript_7778/g.14665 Transcript_7778/m.14665 type:complete len:478 (-) Transcript_7778:1830-3263(-)
MPPKAKKAKITQERTNAPTKARAASAQSGNNQKRVVELAQDADAVLAKCRKLREELKRKTVQRQPLQKPSTGAIIQSNDIREGLLNEARLKIEQDDDDDDVAMVSNNDNNMIASLQGKSIIEVSEMSTFEVVEAIESIAVQIANQVLQKKGFTLEIPSRSASNQIYVPELDRIVLGEKRGTRSFLNVKEARKSAITTRVMQLLHTVLLKRIHITKRDLFYTDVKLFVDQTESDGVLDDIATMIGCTRSNLHVVASDKGLVVGRVSFVEDGDFIDCTKMGVGGKAIPPYVDKITDIQSDAEFVLLVEKEAAYMRMAEDRFYHRYPCIIITAKGQPDVATRMFLSRLTNELKLPVLGLVDSDPYGLKILSVYMSGSKNMSYDSASLTTPDIKWLGLRPSDLEKFDLPDQCRLDMTENDIKTGKELLNEEFIKKNKAWTKELEIMVKTKKKAEIQALSSFGFQYITETYLPQKLKEGDWI